jgi:hypothetical protein
MIQVIHSDDARVFDYALFPEQNPNNYVYIQQNMAAFADALTQTGRQFMEQYRDHYASIDHGEIARKARKVMRAARDLFRPDLILPLETIEELQAAQLKMQRYIMAEPTIRQLYISNKCDGYRDTYMDMQPGRISEDHLDYRKVMTGVVMDTADGGFIARQYLDELPDGDLELAADERFAILRTWDAVKLALSRGEDPTNPFGGDVGI